MGQLKSLYFLKFWENEKQGEGMRVKEVRERNGGKGGKDDEGPKILGQQGAKEGWRQGRKGGRKAREKKRR
jgi:hypothetical protein